MSFTTLLLHSLSAIADAFGLDYENIHSMGICIYDKAETFIVFAKKVLVSGNSTIIIISNAHMVNIVIQ